ncbi:MAG: hypothetical protein WBM17_15740 [Anaerolineales bacterium]
MSFDIFVQCFRNGEPAGLPWQALLLLFPVQAAESTPEFWRIRYDDRNSCDIHLSTLPKNEAFIESLCVHRPCGDKRLWRALFTILRMGNVVLYFPGNSPPLVADAAATAHLPPGMIESLGRPVCIHSAREIRSVVENGDIRSLRKPE